MLYHIIKFLQQRALLFAGRLLPLVGRSSGRNHLACCAEAAQTDGGWRISLNASGCPLQQRKKWRGKAGPVLGI